MALAANTTYGNMVEFAEDTSTPSGSVALYAKTAGSGDNQHLVLYAPTASFTGDVHVTGTLNVEGAINSVNREETNLIVVDKTITVASGSNEANTDGAGLNFGGTTESPHGSFLFKEATLGGDSNYLLASAGLKATGDMTVGDDLHLSSNSAVLNVGSDQKFTATHANANNTLTVTANHRLAFGDAGDYIAGDGSDLLLVSSADVKVTGDLIPSGDDTYDLGTTSAAWQDLHLEGDVLMTDAGKVSATAGDLTLESAAAGVTIDAATTVKIDSAAGDVSFEDNGTAQLAIDMDGTAGEVIMQLKVASDDFVFKTQGGTEVFRVEDNGAFDIAGGYGSSGATISATGAITADSNISTAGYFRTTGNAIRGGGNVDCITFDGSGNTTIPNTLTATGLLTANGGAKLGNANADSINVTGSFNIYNSSYAYEAFKYDSGDDILKLNAYTYINAPVTASNGIKVNYNDDSATAITVGPDAGAITLSTATTLNNTLTVGSDGSGQDVTFYSATSGDHMLWDSSEEQLKIIGTSGQVALDIDTGNLTVGAYGLTDAGVATIASFGANWTNASRTIADLGTVTAATSITATDLVGTNIDGIIGADTARAGTFTSLTATSLELTEGNALNVGSIEADTIQGDAATVGLNLNFDSNTGTDKITLADGQADALSITDGTNDWLVFNTSAETLTFGRNMSAGDYNLTNVGVLEADTIQSDADGTGLNLNFDGNTGTDKVTLKDGQADALSITDGTNDWMVFNTSAETLTFGRNSTFAGTTIANLGTVSAATSITATDLVGTNIDGIIGADTARAGTFTTVAASSTVSALEFSATSDARLKSNIQGVTNAMDVINNIQGVEYDLNETGQHSMGILAQDLIEVAPALVKTRENGNYAVNYSGLSAFFVEAIKEQQAQIEDLKNTVKELSK